MIVPGPQKYDPINIGKSTMPKWMFEYFKSRFGKSLRDPPKKVEKSQVPGPGYYENKAKLGDSAPKVFIYYFSIPLDLEQLLPIRT